MSRRRFIKGAAALLLGLVIKKDTATLPELPRVNDTYFRPFIGGDDAGRYILSAEVDPRTGKIIPWWDENNLPKKEGNVLCSETGVFADRPSAVESLGKSAVEATKGKVRIISSGRSDGVVILSEGLSPVDYTLENQENGFSFVLNGSVQKTEKDTPVKAEGSPRPGYPEEFEELEKFTSALIRQGKAFPGKTDGPDFVLGYEVTKDGKQMQYFIVMPYSCRNKSYPKEARVFKFDPSTEAIEHVKLPPQKSGFRLNTGNFFPGCVVMNYDSMRSEDPFTRIPSRYSIIKRDGVAEVGLLEMKPANDCVHCRQTPDKSKILLLSSRDRAFDYKDPIFGNATVIRLAPGGDVNGVGFTDNGSEQFVYTEDHVYVVDKENLHTDIIQRENPEGLEVRQLLIAGGLILQVGYRRAGSDLYPEFAPGINLTRLKDGSGLIIPGLPKELNDFRLGYEFYYDIFAEKIKVGAGGAINTGYYEDGEKGTKEYYVLFHGPLQQEQGMTYGGTYKLVCLAQNPSKIWDIKSWEFSSNEMNPNFGFRKDKLVHDADRLIVKRYSDGSTSVRYGVTEETFNGVREISGPLCRINPDGKVTGETDVPDDLLIPGLKRKQVRG